MEENALMLVARASTAAAGEIRKDLAGCLRRLDLINLPIVAAHLSLAIDRLDEDIQQLTATSVSELA